MTDTPKLLCCQCGRDHPTVEVRPLVCSQPQCVDCRGSDSSCITPGMVLRGVEALEQACLTLHAIKMTLQKGNEP